MDVRDSARIDRIRADAAAARARAFELDRIADDQERTALAAAGERGVVSAAVALAHAEPEREPELGSRVELVESGERGVVVGVSRFTYSAPSALVRYRAGDGSQVETWWSFDALRVVPAAPEVDLAALRDEARR